MSRKSEKIVFVTRPLKMKGKPKSLGERAGLKFPVRRIYGQLKSGYYASRIGIGAAIYLTAVLEYLSQEILELAAKAALENQKRRISPRHVLLAIRNDEELCLMLKGVVISEGGVLPNIEPELLPKKIAIQKNYLKNPVNASSQEY